MLEADLCFRLDFALGFYYADGDAIPFPVVTTIITPYATLVRKE